MAKMNSDNLGATSITSDDVEACRLSIQTVLGSTGESALLALNKPRTVDIEYRSLSVRVSVASDWGEFNLRRDMFLKAQAMERRMKNKPGESSLVKLFCEDGLKPVAPDRDLTIDVSLIVPFNSCRE